MDAPPEINVSEYIKIDWELCPWCKGAIDYIDDSLDTVDNIAYNGWKCNDCQREWQNELLLDHISWINNNGDRVHSDEHFQD